jgi:hypothetical protein
VQVKSQGRYDKKGKYVFDKAWRGPSFLSDRLTLPARAAHLGVDSSGSSSL